MNIIKCKMCGGDLNIQPGMTVAECLYCGSKQTIPYISDEKKATLYDRAGYYRRNNDYDKAMSIYEQLIAEDNTDAEAHWSAVLCRYGIEYVEDPRSHRRIPTVNRAQYKSILNDPDYQAALRNADSSQYDLYQQEASLIDQIQRGILEVSRKEEPFDIFICYKETDNQGRRTQDSVIAYDIYKELTKEEYRVFFARVTLEDKLGTAYEPYIFAALNSAKIMLAVGTTPENFQSVWVKNEWGRYLALMQENDNKTLIPVYKDMNPYDMPEEFSYLQSQDYGKLGAMQDIVRGVDKILGTKSNNSQNIVTNTTTSTIDNTGALLERAYQFIEEGKWEEAKNYYNRVLDINPKCSNAYLIAAMVDIKARDRKGLVEYDGEIEKNTNFAKAIKFGNIEEKQYLEDIVTESRSVKAETKFNKAVKLMNQTSMGCLKEARKILEELNSNYDVSKELNHCNAIIRKKEKANKTRLARYATLVAVVLFALCIMKYLFIPHYRYYEADKMLDNGQFEDAAIVFENLHKYKDAEEKVLECKYQEAENAEKSEKIYTAYKLYKSLDGYKDSSAKVISLEEIMVNKGDEVVFGRNLVAKDKTDLKWIVLKREDEKVLILCKKSLFLKEFNEGKRSNSWEDSTIQKWLNGTFYNELFSDDEKKKIIQNENDKDDKVFLLSISEAEELLPEDRDRIAFLNSKSFSWWLSSYGQNKDSVAYVDPYGVIAKNGVFPDVYKKGIRPAMWITME